MLSMPGDQTVDDLTILAEGLACCFLVRKARVTSVLAPVDSMGTRRIV